MSFTVLYGGTPGAGALSPDGTLEELKIMQAPTAE
jgi:hypothetical protein